MSAAKQKSGADQKTFAAPAATPQAARAATRIQSVFRGASVRRKNAAAMQAVTPYPSRGHYDLATHNFAMDQRGRSALLKKVDWKVYESTGRIAATEQPAFLHSFQRVTDFDDELKARGTSRFELHQEGNVYEPSAYGGPKQHDMRSNSAWMLGLAHHQAPAVMTTPLDDQTLVRESAQKEKKDAGTDQHFSAFGREVLGMVQHGHFAPVAGPRNKQVLKPSEAAKRATLADFKTPRGKPQSEIKAALKAKGIDVSRIK